MTEARGAEPAPGAARARLGWLLLLGITASGCRSDSRPLPIMTAGLPAPELREPALDPHLAVDPHDPDRAVIVAGYGVGPAHSTRAIWTWTTGTGGKEWTGARMPLPRATAVRAADPAAIFDGDGRALLTFAFADSASQGGAAITTTGRRDLQFGPARRLIPDRIADRAGAVEEPSLAHDGSGLSPLRGSRYLSWLYRTADSSVLWVASTRGPAAPWREGNRILAASAGAIATRSDGTLEVIALDPSRRTILRTSSTDGGLSFAHPDPVVSRPDSLRIGHPVIAVGPGDTALVCWSESGRARPAAAATWCARGTDGGWAAPVTIADPDSPAEVVTTPAAASGAGGLWVLTYRSDATTTEVQLHRSVDGGRTFGPFAVLGSRPFGAAAFCPSSEAGCAGATGRFFPGTRTGLAAAGDRVYAAYVLPDGDRPDGRPTVFFAAVRP